MWKKKYFEEKKKTPMLEDQSNKLRQELESLHRRIMSQLETSREKENKKMESYKLEFLPSDVWVGLRKKMETRLPKAYKFFKNWSIPIGEVNKLIAMVSDIDGKVKVSAKKRKAMEGC